MYKWAGHMVFEILHNEMKHAMKCKDRHDFDWNGVIGTLIAAKTSDRCTSFSMPRERKQRGHRHAEKRKVEREDEEKQYIEAQERDVLFYDRPKNPFGLLTREDEKFFFEVYDEFKKDQWDNEDAQEAFMQNVFMEMKGKELRVATSQLGRFFEMLLARCPRKEVGRIMLVFQSHGKELAQHRFGSYALEKIAGHAGVWTSKELDGTLEDEEGVESIESIEKLFVNMVEVKFRDYCLIDRSCSIRRCTSYLRIHSPRMSIKQFSTLSAAIHKRISLKNVRPKKEK